MFDNTKLKLEIKDLKRQIEHLSATNRQLEIEVRFRKEQTEKIRSSLGVSACGIDFELMKAFTVFRSTTSLPDMGWIDCTAIGYLNHEGKAQEFRICTSQEVHDKVVKQFNEYVKRKK